jgi:hypothetical protein
MTYEYQAGEVPVPAQQCVRCGRTLELDTEAGGRPVGWFQVSALSSTIWVFQSRGEPPAAATERWRCPGCERRYAKLPA